jgi:hypothetical protein
MRAAAALLVHQVGIKKRISKKETVNRTRVQFGNLFFLIFPWCSRRAAAARICWLIPRPRLLDPAPNKRAPLVLPWCLGVLSGFFSFNSRDFPRAGAYGASRLTASMSDVSEEVADIRFKSRGCPRHMLGDQVSRRRRGVSLFRRPGIFASPIQHIS